MSLLYVCIVCYCNRQFSMSNLTFKKEKFVLALIGLGNSCFKMNPLQNNLALNLILHLLIENCYMLQMSHVLRIWYFRSAKSLFKCACVCIRMYGRLFSLILVCLFSVNEQRWSGLVFFKKSFTISLASSIEKSFIMSQTSAN